MDSAFPSSRVEACLVSDLSSIGQELDRAVARISLYLGAVAALALTMSFAYEWAHTFAIDHKSLVLDHFTAGDLMKSLRHWLPLHAANWAIGGCIFFLLARKRLSGLRLLSSLSGWCIGADLSTRLLPAHFAPHMVWLDYVLLSIGMGVALYLLLAGGAAGPPAIKLILASAIGFTCVAGEAGIEDAGPKKIEADVGLIDKNACQYGALESGQLLFGYDEQQHLRYWHESAKDNVPGCNE